VNASTAAKQTTGISAAGAATTKTKSRTRTCWTKQDKAGCPALFAEGGLSASDFCRQLGISAATFSLWRRTARGEAVAPTRSAPGFAQVRLSAAQPDAPAGKPSVAPAVVMMHLPGGARLEVPAGTDAAWLAQVVKTLGGF